MSSRSFIDTEQRNEPRSVSRELNRVVAGSRRQNTRSFSRTHPSPQMQVRTLMAGPLFGCLPGGAVSGGLGELYVASVLPDPLPVPWESRSESVLWSSADLQTQVAFDAVGIKGWQDGAMVADQPWGRVRDLSIQVPYSSHRTVVALTVWDMISPKPASFSAGEIEISFAARFELVRWTLAPPTTYDWRLQFILDDLTRLLNPDFSPLGSPGLLDDAVRRVAPRMRPHARLFMSTDLFGLDRFVGGHTAYDSDLGAVLDQHRRG